MVSPKLRLFSWTKTQDNLLEMWKGQSELTTSSAFLSPKEKPEDLDEQWKDQVQT